MIIEKEGLECQGFSTMELSFGEEPNVWNLWMNLRGSPIVGPRWIQSFLAKDC